MDSNSFFGRNDCWITLVEAMTQKRRGRIKQRPAYPDGVLVPVKEFEALERDKMRLDWLSNQIGHFVLLQLAVCSEISKQNFPSKVSMRPLIDAEIKREGK